jgi:cytidylate kinase
MARRKPIVAIDGPVGAGKSTAARELARELGFACVNTGAMYRALALVARKARVDPDGPDLEQQLAPLLSELSVAFEGERVIVNGRDETARLGEPELGDLASRYSTLATVRARMRELQRAAGAAGGTVMEGRDIGTAIFPEAEVKFFLDADVEVRARRRCEELRAKGQKVSPEAVLNQLLERDRRDRERALAPLRRAPDAIVIDSTKMTLDEVLAEMKRHVPAAPEPRGEG